MPRKGGDPVVQAGLGRIVDVGAGVDHLQCWGLRQSLQHLTCAQVPSPAPSLTLIQI